MSENSFEQNGLKTNFKISDKSVPDATSSNISKTFNHLLKMTDIGPIVS